MAKWIKNGDTVDHTYVGQLITAGTYYEIQGHEEIAWANNSTLISDIGSGIAIVAKDDSGTLDIIDINSAINYLKSIDDVQQDSEGALISRGKVAPTGWSFHMQGVEFTSSTENSIINKDADGNDLGFSTISLYKSDGQGGFTACTDQTDADANCIKTVIDWEPTFDIELIGGALKMSQTTTENIYAYCIGVPDIPAASGGSKEFIHGINMKYIAAHSQVDADGRASKRLNYNATYHTNKMRLILRHDAGIKHGFLLVFEVFKA